MHSLINVQLITDSQAAIRYGKRQRLDGKQAWTHRQCLWIAVL